MHLHGPRRMSLLHTCAARGAPHRSTHLNSRLVGGYVQFGIKLMMASAHIHPEGTHGDSSMQHCAPRGAPCEAQQLVTIQSTLCTSSPPGLSSTCQRVRALQGWQRCVHESVGGAPAGQSDTAGGTAECERWCGQRAHIGHGPTITELTVECAR